MDAFRVGVLGPYFSTPPPTFQPMILPRVLGSLALEVKITGGLEIAQSEKSKSLLCHLLLNFTFTFHFHALEKAMATHSSVLAWRIPGTGEPGGLLSLGLHRVGHD